MPEAVAAAAGKSIYTFNRKSHRLSWLFIVVTLDLFRIFHSV